MKERFLFVRPPRPVWPFNGSSTAFWPPLAFASLAGALLERVRDLDVEILDAPALRMGWRSLTSELRRKMPTYVAIGEEAVSAVEGLRLARLSHELGATVIAGGCFFGNVAREAVRTRTIDVVVHGEGEETLVELVGAMRAGKAGALRHVAGITFMDGEEIVSTPRRHLIADLDRLPLPAYELLPVGRYGHGSRNHPNLAAMELGRGCIGSCDFCVLWRQMGRPLAAGLAPHLRVKSPERVVYEIQRLRRDFDRRYIGWVDPCFNAHPAVPARVADLLSREGVRMGQSAWVRADAIVRDAASGALERLVSAGLNEVYIGVERPDDVELRTLRKTTTVDEVRMALEILARDYRSVFRFGSFIYGVPGETVESLRALYRLSTQLPLDMSLFIPLTPLPGTPFWNPSEWRGEGEECRRFDFLPPISAGERGNFERTLLRCLAFDWSAARLRGYARGLLSRDSRKRRLVARLAARGLRLWATAVTGGRSRRASPGGMVLPIWYNS